MPIASSAVGLGGSIASSLIGSAAAQQQADRANAAQQNNVAQWLSQNVPDPSQLQAELENYKVTGMLSPDLQQAYQSSDAFKSLQTPDTGRTAQVNALQSLENVGNQGGEDAQSQVAQMQAENQADSRLQGSIGAITQNFAARGIGGAGAQMAGELQATQNEANADSMAGTQAAADARSRALAAMEGAGQIGSQVQGEDAQSTQAAASAANTINEFNAANSQRTAAANQSAQNQANLYNTQTGQSVGNQNTGVYNAQQLQHASATQQSYEDALQKASGVSGAYTGQTKQDNTNATNTANEWAGIGKAVSAGAGAIGQALTKQSNGSGDNSGYDSEENDAYGGIVGRHRRYADGGTVDSDDTNTDTDNSDDSPPGAGASSQSDSDLVKAYMQAKLDSSNAANQSASMRTAAAIARAGGLLANSTYGNSTQMDEAPFNALDQDANAPIQANAAAQAAGLKAIQNQSALMSAQKQEALNDPDSDQSKAFRASIEKLAPGISDAYGDDWDNVSAADQDLIMKPIQVREQIDARKQQVQQQLDYKNGMNQDKAYTQLRKDLETFRGNQSAQQAGLAIQNVDRALSLAQSQPTSQNLSLLADEMGKIATGGVPGENGVKALLPDNLATKIEELKAFVLSKPSSADVSAYLQNNVDYLKQVKSIAQNTLGTYRQNIAKGYKNRVSKDDYQEAMDDYNLGGGNGSGQNPTGSAGAVARKTADGRIALFDPNTKQFLGYQQ